MRGFTSVFRRELRGYFSTPLAYVFLVIFLFFSNYMAFQQNFFEIREASLRAFFQNMPLLFIFLGPALAMRLWAEERRTNSIELLFSLPVTVPQAVLGKFCAAWSVLILALALTFPMVLTVAYLGKPDGGPIVAGYIGSALLAGAYLAIGSFFSSLTRSQVIAFVLAVVGCAVFLFAGSPSVTGALVAGVPAGLLKGAFLLASCLAICGLIATLIPNFLVSGVLAAIACVVFLFASGLFGTLTVLFGVQTTAHIWLVAAVTVPLLLAPGLIVNGLTFVLSRPVGLARRRLTGLIFAVVAGVALYFGSSSGALNFLSGSLPMGLVSAVESVSFQSRFESILRGVIELRDVVFFVLLTAGWLWATVVALKGRMAAG